MAITLTDREIHELMSMDMNKVNQYKNETFHQSTSKPEQEVPVLTDDEIDVLSTMDMGKINQYKNERFKRSTSHPEKGVPVLTDNEIEFLSTMDFDNIKQRYTDAVSSSESKNDILAELEKLASNPMKKPQRKAHKEKSKKGTSEVHCSALLEQSTINKFWFNTRKKFMVVFATHQKYKQKAKDTDDTQLNERVTNGMKETIRELEDIKKRISDCAHRNLLTNPVIHHPYGKRQWTN
jgi:hypothetical protein